MHSYGLALGGGGAKGLAHIPLLELIDELELPISAISGTSIGAVLGALYASGMSGAEIRETVGEMTFSKGDSLRTIFREKDLGQWLKFLDLDLREGGLFRGDNFIEFLGEKMKADRFEELQIPLRVIAADFHSSEEVVYENGDLLSAVKASMGLPGVFTPVQRDGRTLIDGGAVNPLPHDKLPECDVVIAIDVMGSISEQTKKSPSLFEAVLETFNVMQRSIIAAHRELGEPTIYIRPDIVDIDLLEFYKMEEVFDQTQSAVAELRSKLEDLLDED